LATSAEYRLGAYAFPRGWFAVANSADAGRKPMNVHYLGQDMVLYRGESGRVVMLDAYCPHMGTMLGSGEHSATTARADFMEGDNIRCPFHAWRFGPDGICNHIPYHDGPIPPGARLKSWRVEERYGIVFAWHDPEGLGPDFDLPDFPQWDDPQWVRWVGLEFLCDLKHPIEIFDNMSDVAHLGHLHGGHAVAYENEYDGHLMHQRQRSAVEHDSSGLFDRTYSTLAGYVGPGIAFGKFQEMGAVQIICITPIEDGTCRLWQTAMTKSRSGIIDDAARQMRTEVSRMFGNGLLRDGEIWKAKRPAIHIMQLPSDGPFHQSRTWYSQFHNPRAKAAGIVSRIAGTHYAKGWPPFTPVPGATSTS
jgi:3-ketosteroid 9alpha-monooxygenase subunit A